MASMKLFARSVAPNSWNPPLDTTVAIVISSVVALLGIIIAIVVGVKLWRRRGEIPDLENQRNRAYLLLFQSKEFIEMYERLLEVERTGIRDAGYYEVRRRLQERNSVDLQGMSEPQDLDDQGREEPESEPSAPAETEAARGELEVTHGDGQVTDDAASESEAQPSPYSFDSNGTALFTHVPRATSDREAGSSLGQDDLNSDASTPLEEVPLAPQSLESLPRLLRIGSPIQQQTQSHRPRAYRVDSLPPSLRINPRGHRAAELQGSESEWSSVPLDASPECCILRRPSTFHSQVYQIASAERPHGYNLSPRHLGSPLSYSA